MPEIILQTQDLTKIYGAGESAVCALDHANVSFERGEFVAVTGASGSGKSTLLHLIGGLDSPSSGKVLYGGEDLYQMNDSKLSAFRRRKIGFVFQSFNLIPELTARENIILPGLMDKRPVSEERLNDLAQTLGISERLSHLPDQLSGGQQQRVAIARALANDPELLLCDEPTGNLDAKSGKEIVEMLKLAREKFGKTIVVVTHDASIAAQADRIIHISDGKIAE